VREHRARRIGRPSLAAPYAQKVAGWLSEDPDLPTQEWLRRAKEDGYTGHKTAFYALVAGARPPRSAPVVRFEGLPGEFSQHEHALLSAIPEANVDVPEVNATFAQAIVDTGVGVEMCAPQRLGRALGRLGQGLVLQPRKFQDEQDLHSQLNAWLTEVNERTPSRATKVIPEIRRREELARMCPIKILPENLAVRVPVLVGPTEVMFEGMPYSMPPKATHVAGTAFVYEDRLHIIAGRFEAEHRRRRKGEPPAPLPEHRAAKLAAVHGKRAKLYEKRQQLLQLGPSALELLTHITHREPRQSADRIEHRHE
jgi:hypothetical protein